MWHKETLCNACLCWHMSWLEVIGWWNAVTQVM